MPNRAIFGGTIENITALETRRVGVSVGAEYPAHIDETRKVLLDAAKGLDGVLSDPALAVVLKGLGASSVDYEIRVWCKTADYFVVMDATTRAAKYAMDAAKQTINVNVVKSA